ncbi:Fungal Zn(2)-Cys(6) binuclear cluster domain [Ceratobasidium sp. AG-Ba]|nr:Fungal Zn(2)-Cys(6) binuclear cluster domain [Ceratobasidium sp. AG-Ba]
MAAPHEEYDPEVDLYPSYEFFYRVSATSGTCVGALAQVTQQDPEGILPSGYSYIYQENNLPEHGQAAGRGLANAGYAGPECEALLQLYIITDSLARGNFGLWHSALDLMLSWVEYAYYNPGISGLSKSISAQFAFRRGIWFDIIAGVITLRTPRHIRIYRKLLASINTHVLDDCSNLTLSVVLEIAALAAHAKHIPGAKANLDRFRKQLAGRWCYTLDVLSIKAAIHTAGAQLYLEVTAYRGAVDHPSIRDAAEHVWRLASWAGDEQRQEIKFWIFLAGCHTPIRDIYDDCRMMLHNIFTKYGDAAAGAAMGGFLFSVATRTLTVH